MNEKWQPLPLDKAVQINPPVRLKKGKVYPFVSMQSVKPGQQWTEPQEYREFSGGGARFQHGDTLMARITPSLEHGKITRFRGTDPNSVGFGSTEFIVFRGRPGVTDNNFVYYLISSPLVHSYAISQMTGTSGRQRVPTDSLKHLTIPLPPLPEQRAIAHILGALDDKIALNRRMNATLEAMARALFKSWFVDFDPVRAKRSGRWKRGESLPGLPAHLYDLFPDRLVPSELGEIPEGWKVTSILEYSERLSGGTPNTNIPEYWNGSIKWVSAKDVRNSHGSFIIDTEKKISQLGIDHSSAKILPKNTTVITARGTVGSYCILAEPMAINQTNYGIKTKLGFGDYFVFYTVANLIDWLQQNSYGTIFDTITTKTLAQSETIFPGKEVIQAFDRAVLPFMLRIRHNKYESLMLANVRENILPKLITGKISVNSISTRKDTHE